MKSIEFSSWNEFININGLNSIGLTDQQPTKFIVVRLNNIHCCSYIGDSYCAASSERARSYEAKPSREAHKRLNFSVFHNHRLSVARCANDALIDGITPLYRLGPLQFGTAYFDIILYLLDFKERK